MSDPREGHLTAIIKNICIPKNHPKARIIMDTNDLDIETKMIKDEYENISDQGWTYNRHYNFLIQYTNHLVCKRQNSIESSTFRSEFVAFRVTAELNDALGYKLSMFGIPLLNPPIVTMRV